MLQSAQFDSTHTMYTNKYVYCMFNYYFIPPTAPEYYTAYIQTHVISVTLSSLSQTQHEARAKEYCIIQRSRGKKHFFSI